MNLVAFTTRFHRVPARQLDQRQQLIAIQYLKAENGTQREWLNGRSLRFTDKERALLARKAFGIPRRVVLKLGTIVTPGTLLRWAETHRSQVRLHRPAQSWAAAHDAPISCQRSTQR